mmetsp:Transcript_13571/g.20523  ORF Transcript_13571/g.20523 Transcript_13571/m.20523 type:complete len:89 (+) Transcript_13571:575-841(+)
MHACGTRNRCDSITSWNKRPTAFQENVLIFDDWSLYGDGTTFTPGKAFPSASSQADVGGIHVTFHCTNTSSGETDETRRTDDDTPNSD